MQASGVHTSPKHSLSHILQKLDLLLKLVGRKLSCYSKTSSTGKFRSRCSRDREARRSSKAIGCQFARIYLSAVSANFFESRILVMPWEGFLHSKSSSVHKTNLPHIYIYTENTKYYFFISGLTGVLLGCYRGVT